MIKKRLCYIDSLKGFAILLVVIGHVFDGYINATMYTEHTVFMSSAYNLIYSFHMPLFFIVSGYVFRVAYFKDENSPKPSLKSQIINVILIYVLFSILFGAFKIVCGQFTNSDTTIKSILMIFIKPIYPYWYLYILIFFYLIFSRKKVLECNNIVILSVLIIASCLSGFIKSEFSGYFEIKHFLFYLVFFFIGELLYTNKLKLISNLYVTIILFIISIALMFAYRDGLALYNEKHAYNTLAVWNFFIALGISLMLFLIFKKLFSNENLLHVKFFSFLGRYSLEIYVIHCVFTAGNRVILPKLHINYFWLNIVCNIIISTAVPILISVILKRLNLHQKIFKPVTIIYRRRKVNNE